MLVAAHSTPYAVVEGAGKFIEFLQQAFDAKVNLRMDSPDGKVSHCELTIGDSVMMLGDANPQTPKMSVGIYLYVSDVDATHKRAVAAGAKEVVAPATQFYGDRNSRVIDPWGNTWGIATHVEDVPPEEINRRIEEMMKKSGK